MNFMQFLKSLDDLLYEIVTWLVFYPVTLWRALSRPLGAMAYADRELSDPEEQQYQDSLSPPLFLMLTLLLSHGLELSIVGQSDVVASRRGLAVFVSDDTSLLLFRVIAFSVFPIVMSLLLLARKKLPLNRDTLRDPFYAQCYPTAVFALVLELGSLTMHGQTKTMLLAGAVICLIALLWYGIVQARWFAAMLDKSFVRGFGIATLGMILAIVGTTVITSFVG